MTGKGSGTLIDFDKLAADMGDLNEQPVLETARRVAEEEPESYPMSDLYRQFICMIISETIRNLCLIHSITIF